MGMTDRLARRDRRRAAVVWKQCESSTRTLYPPPPNPVAIISAAIRREREQAELETILACGSAPQPKRKARS